MTTNIGLGFSQDFDIEKAAQEAAFRSKTNIGVDKINFCFILSTPRYVPAKTIPIIKSILNNTKVITGSTTPAIILPDSVETNGLAVITITSDDINWSACHSKKIFDDNAYEIGMKMAQDSIQSFSDNSFKLLFICSDLYKSLFLKGIQDVLGKNFPVISSTSDNNFNSINSFQILNDNILKQSSISLMIGGKQSKIGVGSCHGWHPLGKPRLVESSEDNIIKIINGEPAAKSYKDYFNSVEKNFDAGSLKKVSALYPLGIYTEDSNECLIRNVNDILPDGSIVCQGNVPEKSTVHIMIGKKDSCLQSARKAALEAKEELFGRTPKLILVINSDMHLKLFGRSGFKEIIEIKAVFGSDIPIIGLYSNGGICPLTMKDGQKITNFQNGNIIVAALS